jgi:hypothetical protein
MQTKTARRLLGAGACSLLIAVAARQLAQQGRRAALGATRFDTTADAWAATRAARAAALAPTSPDAGSSSNSTATTECVRISVGASVSAASATECATALWPLPKRYAAGASRRVVDPALSFVLHGDSAKSEVLLAAAARYGLLLFPHGGVTTGVDDDDAALREVRRAAATGKETSSEKAAP